MRSFGVFPRRRNSSRGRSGHSRRMAARPRFEPNHAFQNGRPARGGNRSFGDAVLQELKHVRGRRSGLGADFWNIVLLLILYTLQGIPMGMSGSIPFLLSSRGVSYTDQAYFSMASTPFSVKLLWAPIVDTVWSRWIGMRKTWLIPTQLIGGFMMIWMSFFIEELLGDEVLDPGQSPGTEVARPQVGLLTLLFLILYFLMATQDIAVDGWALTILRKENVGYAGTCNSIGQNLGYFLSYVIFLAFNSPEFCNAFRSPDNQLETGVVSLGGFMLFWGGVFVAVTLVVMLFKQETPEPRVVPALRDIPTSFLSIDGASSLRGLSLDPDSPEESFLDLEGRRYLNSASPRKPLRGSGGLLRLLFLDQDLANRLLSSYKQLWDILRLPAMQQCHIWLLTSKIAFAATDSVTHLKLLEYGLPREHLAVMAMILVPVGILTPAAVARCVSGPRPLNSWLLSYPIRILLGLVSAGIVYLTPMYLSTESFLSTAAARNGEEEVARAVNGGGGGDDDGDPIGGTAGHGLFDLPTQTLVFYALILGVTLVQTIVMNIMFVSQMSFFSQISDPGMGGTYMTLLNTIANIGVLWPNTLVLYLVDLFTVRGETEQQQDGYFFLVGLCTLLGMLWFWRYGRGVKGLQDYHSAAWRLSDKEEGHDPHHPEQSYVKLD